MEIVRTWNCEEYDKPNFYFVIATRRKREEAEGLPALKCLSMMDLRKTANVSVAVEFENSGGLSTTYNRFLYDYEHKLTEKSYVVFVHDDIWINDVLFFEKIESASKRFDVIGAVGGKAWNAYGDGNIPMIWTHAAGRHGMSGFMMHKIREERQAAEESSIFASGYGNAPARTLTLDGCILCFTKKAVDSGLRFDETFKFHFYDMDVCFSAFIKKLSVGTAPMLLTHESVGMSASSNEFMDSQKKFLSKWFESKKSG